MKNIFEGLTVLRGLLDDPVLSCFGAFASGEENARETFLYRLYECNAQDNFAAYVAKLVVGDDNAFSRLAAAGEVSPFIQKRYLADLSIFAKALEFQCDGFCTGKAPLPVGGFNEDSVERLKQYYRKNGYGIFLYSALRYDRTQTLVPIATPSPVTLANLKGYEREKHEVRDNFENFLRGLPFSDMLLYGDRGTGKSSTVHAMANEFAAQKLRLVELAKEDILELPRLKTYLSQIPMRFVVFIDDFSLSEEDDRVSTLKAALQGSMEGHAENVMIVATSNRRHIVEETFEKRRDSVHSGDSEQELLSLSDRFGVTVLFSATNKAEYLAIVRALSEELALKTPVPELESLAERWALYKGGRSPRRARQFVDYVYACEQKNTIIEL